MNEYVQDTPDIEVMKIDPKIERDQVDRVRVVRSRRDATRHAEALSRIDTAAKGKDNLLPLVLDAVKAEATVGEIAGVLRDVWGEHQETLVL